MNHSNNIIIGNKEFGSYFNNYISPNIYKVYYIFTYNNMNSIRDIMFIRAGSIFEANEKASCQLIKNGECLCETIGCKKDVKITILGKKTRILNKKEIDKLLFCVV